MMIPGYCRIGTLAAEHTLTTNQPMNEPEQTQSLQALEKVRREPPAQLEAIPEFSVFSNMANFEQAQRMAMALCSSSIVPDTYRGKDKIGDCLIALEIANRIGASILAVMQNLYIVYGKPAWSSQFLISCINASRRFSPIRYQMNGEQGQDNRSCVAWMTDKSGERLESPAISIGMAKSEGWFQKNGSKWKTMPELMLRYRAATLLARLYAPELTMGIQTDDEVIDIGIVETSPVVTEPTRPNFGKEPVTSKRTVVSTGVPARQAQTKPAASTGSAVPPIKEEVLPQSQSQPAQEKTVQKEDKPAEEAPKMPQDDSGGMETPPEPSNEQGDGNAQEPAQPKEPTAADLATNFRARPGEGEALTNIRYLLQRDGVQESALVAWCHGKKLLKPEQKSIADMSERKLIDLGNAWDNNKDGIKHAQA